MSSTMMSTILGTLRSSDSEAYILGSIDNSMAKMIRMSVVIVCSKWTINPIGREWAAFVGINTWIPPVTCLCVVSLSIDGRAQRVNFGKSSGTGDEVKT